MSVTDGNEADPGEHSPAANGNALACMNSRLEVGGTKRFTKENAREAWERSQRAREANKEQRKRDNAEFPHAGGEAHLLKAKIRKIERLIELVERELAETPLLYERGGKNSVLEEMEKGTRTLDNLYSIWALLTGHERPAVRKARKASKVADPLDNMLPNGE